MLNINWSDVISVLESIRPYLIVMAIAIIVAVIIMFAVKNLEKPKKYLIRTQAFVAMFLVVVVSLNLICTGPLATLLSLISGTGTISEETQSKAEKLCMDIADEGVVLLKNENKILPMTDNKNVNVFGWASTNPCYGGTGSGALSGSYPVVDLLEGLEKAGIQTNKELSDFYREYRAERPAVEMFGADWTLPEPPVDEYPDEMLENAKEYSDKAIVVFTRVGGEHIDLPTDVTQVDYTDNSEAYQDFPEGTHYLELSQSEKNMLEMVCDNFDNVIVIYNGANTLELGFVNEYEQIKGAVWCPGAGQNGFLSLGNILAGNVNPSGRTADTFAADLTKSPTWNNFGNFLYENMDEFKVSEDDPYVPGTVPHFVNYTEGIYVGYKFYETASDEGLIDYDEEVVYPFGYGLSYTSFEQKMGEIQESEGKLSVDVTVTNTGDVAGKEVIQLYDTPPYINGGIEKSSANLIAFDKTEVLEPGASQTVTLTFLIEDLASYDYQTAKAYVLEKGDYVISLRDNSHEIIETKTYSVENDITYGDDNKRSTDEIAAINMFGFAEGEITYLSRKDGFDNFNVATAAPASYNMPDADKEKFVNNTNWIPEEDPDIAMPTTNADNHVSLEQLRGKEMDDPMWDDLLDQMSVSEMKEMIALGGFQTIEVQSVGKLQTTDCDGPASINNNFTGIGSIGFACGVMVANTFNEDIAKAYGEGIGTMADEMNVSGWYAPSMNIHRSAFWGRNFEYYSEDGLLSGKIAAQAVQGAAENGVYAYIKHFAMNSQETGRWEMLTEWANEQAIREIYLKPFEIAVKEGNAHAVMSSYNYIGTQWAGACNALLNTVLREEWGFEGFVLTDYFANFEYMDAMRSIYYGGDTCLANFDAETNYISDTSSATTVDKMRTSVHNIMYTIVNSRAYEPENMSSGLLLWQKIMIGADVLLVALLIAFEVFVVRKGYQKRKYKVEVISEEKSEAKQ